MKTKQMSPLAVAIAEGLQEAISSVQPHNFGV